MKSSQPAKVLQVRVSGKRLQKLEEIKQCAGLTTSKALRRLIDAAEFAPASIAVNLSTKAESNGIHQDSTVAFSI